MPDDPMELAERLANLDPARPWYSIEATAAGDGERRRAKVNIYDAIGGWFGVNAAQFVRELSALDVDDIEVHLNSPGGAAWDGIAIMNALRQHQARVTVIIDGLAASAASVIALGGDEVVMARGSQLMIHDASGGAWGPAAFVRKTADILDKLSNNYASIYAARAGGTVEDWRALMLAETWYDADEAVAVGLVDRTDDTEADAEATAAFDLSIFTYAGRSHAPAPGHLARFAAIAAAPKTPVSSEPGHTTRKESPVDHTEFLSGLRDRLGVTSDADETVILAALDETLAEQATTTETPGVVSIDSGVLDQLRADAAAGRQALEAQTSDRRDAIIAASLREGRITKASEASFRAQLDRDEDGTKAILATLAPSGAVPVDLVGYTGSDETSPDDANYAAIYNRKEA